MTRRCACAVLVLAGTLAAVNAAAARADGPRLELAPLPERVRVGDVVVVEARVRGLAGARVRFATTAANDAFVARALDPQPDADDADAARCRFTYVAAAPGLHAPPAVVATLTPRDPGAPRTLERAPPPIHVESALGDAATDAADLPLEDDLVLEPMRPVGSIGARVFVSLTAAVLFAAFLYWRARRGKATDAQRAEGALAVAPADRTSPEEVALARLRNLAAADFDAIDAAGPVAAIADVARVYLRDRFGLPAPERTAAELIPLLAPEVDAAGCALLGPLLAEAEHAKYAGIAPPPERPRAFAAALERWIAARRESREPNGPLAPPEPRENLR